MAIKFRQPPEASSKLSSDSATCVPAEAFIKLICLHPSNVTVSAFAPATDVPATAFSKLNYPPITHVLTLHSATNVPSPNSTTNNFLSIHPQNLPQQHLRTPQSPSTSQAIHASNLLSHKTTTPSSSPTPNILKSSAVRH